jgi:hypothetical protein
MGGHQRYLTGSAIYGLAHGQMNYYVTSQQKRQERKLYAFSVINARTCQIVVSASDEEDSS